MAERKKRNLKTKAMIGMEDSGGTCWGPDISQAFTSYNNPKGNADIEGCSGLWKRNFYGCVSGPVLSSRLAFFLDGYPNTKVTIYTRHLSTSRQINVEEKYQTSQGILLVSV